MSEDFKIVTRKSFNVAGPCNPSEHYMLPALARLPGVVDLIVGKQFFVIHAARQSGKTTALKYLADKINASGNMCALYCSLEAAQQFPNPAEGIEIIARLISEATQFCPPLAGRYPPVKAEPSMEFDNPIARRGVLVRSTLFDVAKAAGMPLTVFFDEADCLGGDTLITFLRQLRDGYVNRGVMPFPVSVALVGMRNIQDFKLRVCPDSESLGTASPFNIIADTLTLRTFTEVEVRELYAQHTTETGQVFDDDVFDVVMHWTGGQPWLVNAIARECVEKIHRFHYDESITVEDVLTAKETIIRRRDTHILSLMGKLDEERVMRIVEPVISGQDSEIVFDSPDCQYVLDLGILKIERNTLVPANQMYAEMIVRYLSYGLQTNFGRTFEDVPWISLDGLDMNWLVKDFQTFWREQAGAWKDWQKFKEAGPHILFMAFLQRVVNGGGLLTREMALGSYRMDIGLKFRGRSYGVEIKLKPNYRRETALAQVRKYLDVMDAPEGWLLVFDPTPAEPTDLDARLTWEDVEVDGKTVHIVGF